MSTIESTTLRKQEGSSDKTYTVAIVEKEGGFIVQASWGKTGGSQRTQEKTKNGPVPVEEARKLYDKLIAGQVKDHYLIIDGGKGYEHSSTAGRDTGVRVQLFNALDESEVERYLADSRWGMQEKYDGERRTVHIVGDRIFGANRDGREVALSMEVIDVIRDRIRVTGETIIDGEDFGTTFAPFELLKLNGVDLTHTSYKNRLELLEQLTVEAVEMPRPFTYRTTEHKRRMFEQLRAGGFEGVIFVDMEGTVTPGRPASGGNKVKFKFTESASCRVIDRNGDKRSVAVELLNAEKGLWVAVGSCTIPPNHPIPTKGAIVEVGYLYAYRNGSLFQPTYKGIRRDVDAAACTIDQLKYKVEQAHSQAA